MRRQVLSIDRSIHRSVMIMLMAGSLLGGGSAALASQSATQPSGSAQPVAGAPAKVSALGQAMGASLAELPQFGTNFSTFNLENGMQVVVIPDHRAPVVTHMVWYRAGAADEKPGVSGIAHFLEHLMFKGTKAHPDGEFSKIVASLGGEENAFTTQDYTAYYQRVAKQHLKLMMELEADRMANLQLTDEQVKPELKVILEERAMRIDTDPSSLLSESLDAALYRNHPYGIPVIGWEHEMEQLDRQDAIDWYNEFYTPNNAILIVAGDINEDEVRAMAEETYGKVLRRAEPKARLRPLEPPQRTARTLTLTDERVSQPSVRRAYMVPSDHTATNGEAEALDLLTYILGSGPNSRLYKSLVMDNKIATSAGAYYQSTTLDDTDMMFYGIPAAGKSVDDVLTGIKGEIDKIIKEGVSEEEVARAKRAILAQTFYAQDNQASLARIVGTALATGQDLDALRKWPEHLAAVTPEQVVAVAAKYLQESRSVTGYLLPPGVSAGPSGKAADCAPGADQPMPKARAMSYPKEAPRASQKVPNPQSRPQGQPKPKPAADAAKTPASPNAEAPKAEAPSTEVKQ
ncbi:M16 family metallopeptidase [Cohaesibacter haloalkalitolerans]|uniref:M16 family metallopeptidase n=1 Tax=Cohaesibacter haloalkalitolerans TaxID=1162980 RepID=UPI001FE047E3|nr:pitrilysin family protein [Cohaesibacter haloalkalitolerans]